MLQSAAVFTSIPPGKASSSRLEFVHNKMCESLERTPASAMDTSSQAVSSSTASCVECIATYTLTSMRLKQEKWQKMMATKEFRLIVCDWIHNSQRRLLVMTLHPAGYLQPKNSISDLHSFHTSAPTTTPTATTATLSIESSEAMLATAEDAADGGRVAAPGISNSTSAAVAAATTTATAVAAAAAFLSAPIPPPNSSFSTLDGVPRGKCVFFIRRELGGAALTLQNFAAHILVGDLPLHSRIETSSALFDEIYFPLLENPFNRKLWPEIVGNDLQACIKNVRKIISEIKGTHNNRTVLSLLLSPKIIEEVAALMNKGDFSAALEPKFRSQLEEMFINWTTQIYEVVHQKGIDNPKCNQPVASSHGIASQLTADATPADEIAFWSNRKLNLHDIYEQLRSPPHATLAAILQGIGSPYQQPFTKVFKAMVEAWHEAQDISLWLQPLLRRTSAFSSLNFNQSMELIEPLVHVVHLIWTNSRFYRSTQRMSVLLRSICNFLVQRASENLEFSTLFQGDADERLQKIAATMEVLEFFRSKINDYKERYSNRSNRLEASIELPPPTLAATNTHSDGQQLWRFSNEDVFGRAFDVFLLQLQELRTVFEAATLFQVLEKCEMGGLRGKFHTQQVKQIYAEFKVIFEAWTDIDIDLTQHGSAKWRSFKREQQRFFDHTKLLEKKLATLLRKAFDDCSNWEHFIKLALMFGNIIRRPIIRAELQPLLPHICAVYSEELLQLENSVHEALLTYSVLGSSAVPTQLDRNMPPIAGTMMWIEKHLKRCGTLAESDLNDFIQKLIEANGNGRCNTYELLNCRRDILTTKLFRMQQDIWQHWLRTIDACIDGGLEQPILVRDERSRTRIVMNCSDEIFTLLKETKYLLAMLQMRPTPLLQASLAAGLPDDDDAAGVAIATSLPAPLLKLYESRNEFWQRRIKLYTICEHYNGIQEDVRPEWGEKLLIQNELHRIDVCVDDACHTLTWRSEDTTLIDKLHTETQQLHQRLHETHSNLDKMLVSIRRWSREPLHQRSLYGRNLLELRHQKERLRARLQHCNETRILINRLLIANFCLFFNYAEEEGDAIHSPEQSVVEILTKFPEEQRRQYVTYLAAADEMICSEVRHSIKISLQFLSREMSSAKHSANTAVTPINNAPLARSTTSATRSLPLFEVQLQLIEREILFAPSFNPSEENSFQKIVEQLLKDIRQTCNIMPRIVEDKQLSAEQQASNTEAADETSELQTLHMNIEAALADSVQQAMHYAAGFSEYNLLWTQRKEDVLRSSLNSVRANQSTAKDVGYAILETFKNEIEHYHGLQEDIEQFDSYHNINGWLSIDIQPLKYALLNHACKWANLYKEWLLRYVRQALQMLTSFIAFGAQLLELPVQRGDLHSLLRVLSVMEQIELRSAYAENVFKPLRDIAALLKSYNVDFEAPLLRNIEQLPPQWKHLKETAATKSETLVDIRRYQQHRLTASINIFNCRLNSYAKKFEKLAFFQVPCHGIYALCDDVCERLTDFGVLHKRLTRRAELLGIKGPDSSNLLLCAAEVKRVKQLWDFVHTIESCIVEWKSTAWHCIDTDEVENESKRFTRDLRSLDKSIREWQPYTYIVAVLKDFVSSLRAITELQNAAITDKHWLQLMQVTRLYFKSDSRATLDELLSLQLHKHEEEIKTTVDRAIKEMTVCKVLDGIKSTWSHMEFDTEPHAQRQLQVLKVSEELVETLDDNQVQLQNIATSKHIENMMDNLTYWQRMLSSADGLISIWFEVQCKWIYLESIFIESKDIREQLPTEVKQFEEIDADFTQLLSEVARIKVVMQVVLQQQNIFTTLEQLLRRLSICEKALNDYLETKRLTFPRFYFISSADLLNILSNENKPQAVDRHLIKLFDSILRLEFESNSNRAIGMYSKENDEYVRFLDATENSICDAYVECTDRVERWLNKIVVYMRCTLHELFRRSLHAFSEKPRDQWLSDWPAQVALCCSQIFWTRDVNRAFAWIEEGYETAMKDLHKRQITQLNGLINLLLGDLRPGDRQKIMTICTIDVHSRDVVGRIIQAKIDSALAFQWQSQLRHRWDETTIAQKSEEDCFANICDAEFRYAYEYLGNTSRLVITPLTDRCYITLTQSLHLVMGGAPAGPAGTGKTETTKDLGRALGIMVYVFNCSEQMDYKSCGNIYKGLAQTGAWGCFDEFNRISVEVLSVVAVQVKTIQEAIKLQKCEFVFMGELISLIPSVGIFITMNPGYAGRTELPENLKTLFRPCAMIVPDFALICEIMLMAEGFQGARLLARKFITLYTLCRELLSKQDHYDWGLRAIKSVLVVAGTLKRDDRSRPEDQVLMRALRDFNIPKIITEDVSIFMGLIGDLFPAIEVPRKRVFEFEKTIRRAVSEVKLQPEESFLMKVVQLQELLDVRHSVFIVGNAGTGKTKIWQTLLETYRIQKLRPTCNILNPKALSNDELFGVVNSATREWKDGLFSSIMREQSNLTTSGPKWIVLDGDIDPMWIESLNTLMDDNKVLTLASNERISLKKDMRLLFEVGHLKAATPATVSRAGILYINPQDLGWSPYDRQRLVLKNIRNCQFAACMNPTAGSFTIDPRLQRHFCVFSLAAPDESLLLRIYGSIFCAHINNPQHGFTKEIKSIAKLLVQVGIALHRRVEHTFLPTATKFHYIFNMRDLSNIYQGMLNSVGCGLDGTPHTGRGTICTKPNELIRLYVHEAYRVYHDRLVDPFDIKSFKSSIRDIFKKDIEDFDEEYVFAEPLIYSHFALSLIDHKYMPIRSWETLHQLLMEAQSNYNELVGYMNLVMFEDAMIHVCRIGRILESPRGNALLIGVGGSGKQTLARLSAFISSLNVFQLQVKRGFCLSDIRDEIAGLFMKVGLKNAASIFLLSDAQIPDETVLLLINDLLATGEIPELFADDQMETIINGIRNEVKQSGSLDTKENCWRFFVDKVRRTLKVVLCFSPVGQTLRIRARKFPAILNRTCIDWFHEWPTSALESVSQKFLIEIGNELPRYIISSIARFMAFVHGTVNQISKIYLQNEKRFNYTTPKTFLEYIFLYRKLLVQKSEEHTHRIQRLQSGTAKLAECAFQVDTLKDQLDLQEVQLNAKNAAADKLIVIVSAESEKVKHEQVIASEEEKKVLIIEEDVSIKTKLCEEDLRKAEPALVAAQAALNTLNKNNLTELKSFGSPPKAVVNVCAAVMVLLGNNSKIPRDRSWKAAKLMMVRVDQFLNDLVNYNKDNIHASTIEVLQEYLSDPEFHPDKVVQKSVAAAGLCAWVINVYRYHQVFLIVGPKKKALQDSQDELMQARERLHFLKGKLNNLEAKLSSIQADFEHAVAEKQKCQREADKTAFTIDLAHRLVNGLANENVRWKESVQSLQLKIATLPGDILLVSSFLSYVGCFTWRYRQELQQKMWMPRFCELKPQVPHTRDADPLALFSDDAQVALWNNEGLPMDRMSTENATILVHSTRWPLMIDPQLQGIKWIKNHCGEALVVIRLTQRNYLEILEKSMLRGDTVLIEQIEETMDTVLEPLLSRSLIKKGRYILIGDKEMDFHPNFRLILHTKLANPHYKPEMQAQTTLINFTVTPDGLEEQLLAEVVKIERPDLEHMKTELTTQQNKFKITLKQLEDDLLARLASAGENVLDDHALVINLETTKRTVDEIELKVNEARATTQQIDETRNIYRVAAKRSAILYFVLTDLSKVNPIYKFSLKSFMGVFKQAIAIAPADRKLECRVEHLVNSITLQTFLYTLRGLFEVDKLTFTAHMILRIMKSARQVSTDEVDFLLRFPHDPNTLSPLEFVERSAWGGIKSLAQMENFYGIDKDMEIYPKRWHKFLCSDVPEREQFPGEWKHRSPLQKLCIIRALRPDRITYAMRLFVERTMGREYAEAQPQSFRDVFKETTASTPIFFILLPGVNPLRDVERLGAQLGYQESAGTIRNISLGQGQEHIAEQAIAEASKSAAEWVILQNIHLVVNWLPKLEKIIERIVSEEGTAEIAIAPSKFRLFISAEPAPDPQYHVIPQGILESSIKIVNEPPTGMAANLHKAWDNFDQAMLETCTQEAEFKSILFALCYFHAVVGERRKFGPQGWNKLYPFNAGDLSISASVLHNYLEGSSRIPWEDLRYLFGEIMYGGHITDDWDRRLCQSYLKELLQQELIDGDFELCPGFPSPPNLDFQGYHDYITEMLPAESPILYGLHPNAEIGFLTSASENMLHTIFELQPRESELSTHYGAPREELVKIMIDDFLDKLQEEFNLQALLNRVERKSPFVVVALQECERMNSLIREIKRSLRELMLGLKGELTITQEMDRLDHAIFFDHVPESWTRLAYPSLLGLQAWFADLLQRIKELKNWLGDFKLPCTIWLGGLFNPQSFLTAIMQESARKHDLPLDRMCLCCDVTKKYKDDVTLPPMEGAFVHALYLDGASWDSQLNSIVSLRPKELLCAMPVIYVRSIVQEKQELLHIYECPLYKTRSRGNTFVWTFNLKTRERSAKWILAGVALLLQP